MFTTFAYGCGLGPTEAARHLGGTVSADQIAFADRRHVDIEDLRAASADLINLYAQFELPQQWGTGQSVGTTYPSARNDICLDRGRVARIRGHQKATENAKELLRDLNISYNKARQNSITNAILEIVSGAEALKG